MGAANLKISHYIIILALALWLAWNLASLENFRTVLNTTVGLLLFFFMLFNRSRGILAFFAWLPFLGFQRRFVYSLSPYTRFDPILLIAPIITIFLASWCFVVKREEVLRLIKRSPAAKALTILLLLFLLQMFNPLQGGILVGLGGALFYVIPPLWFYIARLLLERETIQKLLNVILVTGFIAALYGIYQAYFGFQAFEKYWVEHGGYIALYIDPGGGRESILRGFSTFASAAEYDVYITATALMMLALIIHRKWFMIIPFLAMVLLAMILEGTRGSLFMLIFGTLGLIALRRATPQRGTGFAITGVVIFLVFMNNITFRAGLFEDIHVLGPFLERGIEALVDPWTKTTASGHWHSIYANIWWAITHPMGYLGFGLGSTTLAAMKFGGKALGSEFDVSNVVISAGVVGGVLYVMVLWHIFKRVITLFFHSRYWLYPTTLVYLFNMLGHGVGMGEYVMPLIFWALAGFLDREYEALQGDAGDQAAHHSVRWGSTRRADHFSAPLGHPS